jgi:hypothetical protein
MKNRPDKAIAGVACLGQPGLPNRLNDFHRRLIVTAEAVHELCEDAMRQRQRRYSRLATEAYLGEAAL